jgi:hypothetical protein
VAVALTPAAAVDIPELTPTATHSENASFEPSAPVFPVLHTLYDYNERI